MNEINFLISLAWAKGSLDVGDPMLKIEKCCEGVRAPQKSEINLGHVIQSCDAIYRDSVCKR